MVVDVDYWRATGCPDVTENNTRFGVGAYRPEVDVIDGGHNCFVLSRPQAFFSLAIGRRTAVALFEVGRT